MEYPEYKCNAIRNLVGSGFHMNADHSIEYLNGQTPPTEEAINAEIEQLKAEYDALAWKRSREAEYPSIPDQLDEIYHNGINSWKAVIKVTKDKYPKG